MTFGSNLLALGSNHSSVPNLLYRRHTRKSQGAYQVFSLCSIAQYSFIPLHLAAFHVCYKYNVQGFYLYLEVGKVEK